MTKTYEITKTTYPPSDPCDRSHHHWFDGKPAVPNPTSVITIERIRELQPGIVINPRLHNTGDYVTYERTLATDKVATGWAEFCNTWTNSWPYVNGARFRAKYPLRYLENSPVFRADPWRRPADDS